MDLNRVYLAGHSVEIACDNADAQMMLDFMFNDISTEHSYPVESSFSIECTGTTKENIWKITRNDELVHQNPSLTDAANYLMGEVLFDLINNNQQYMAIHAALLSDENGAILVPGESGNGKSSLAIWMTLNGYYYHTDELVMIKAGSLETHVFTRPFNIKAHGIDAIGELVDVDQLKPAASKGNFITMIPHRALNPHFKQSVPAINCILFPKYGKQAKNRLTPLSRAAAGIKLMKTHVIARNLPNHGFEQLLDIVKTMPAYNLSYQHFDALPHLMAELKNAT